MVSIDCKAASSDDESLLENEFGLDRLPEESSTPEAKDVATRTGCVEEVSVGRHANGNSEEPTIEVLEVERSEENAEHVEHKEEMDEEEAKDEEEKHEEEKQEKEIIEEQESATLIKSEVKYLSSFSSFSL